MDEKEYHSKAKSRVIGVPMIALDVRKTQSISVVAFLCLVGILCSETGSNVLFRM